MPALRRREFITLLGSAAAWPLAARAQQGERVRRIGVLINIAENDPESPARLAAFRQTLGKLGWSEDRNVVIDFRWSSGDINQMRARAKELIGLIPDVVVAEGTPSTAAFREESRATPIVFLQAANPVGSGFVASLAHPGGNITGFTNFEPSMGGKWLELLKQIAPGVARAGALFNPQTHTGQYWQAIEAAAQSLAVEFARAPVHSAAEIENVIGALAKDPNAGLLVMPDSFTLAHRELIIALATRHRLPTIYAFRVYATSGGLMCYGVDPVEDYRRAASYVDRILKGEKPADLPVQAPTKFLLVINLKAAKALGLTVPDKLLVAADEVID